MLSIVNDALIFSLKTEDMRNLSKPNDKGLPVCLLVWDPSPVNGWVMHSDYQSQSFQHLACVLVRL